MTGSIVPDMAIVMLISFIWSWIATKEIYQISQVDPVRAAIWGTANASLNYILTFIIAATLTLVFIFPYVLGSTLATYTVLRRIQK